MTDQDYIVFQVVPQDPQANREAFGTLAAGRRRPEVKVDVQALSPADVADARRAPGVVVAEPVPTKLIEPVDLDDAVPAAGAAVWGIGAVGADVSQFTGAGVKVAVLDTGIDSGHEAFANLNVTEEDFTGEGNGDQHGHGTHCAGTIAGGPVGGTRIGIAPGISELLVAKVLGAQGGETGAICKAMTWAAENGAQVVSMSLGIDFPGLVKRWIDDGLAPEAATSRALQAYRDNLKVFGATAAFIAADPDQPIVVAAATGNESERGAAQPYTIDVAPPAASEGFVRVAALGQDGASGFEIAKFSNTGPSLAAPGVGIVSAKAGGGLTTMSGTSMATPHVAGVAALWAEQLGQGTTTDMLRGKLIGQARQVTGLSRVDGGIGLVQAP